MPFRQKKRIGGANIENHGFWHAVNISQDMEDWTGKTESEIKNEAFLQAITPGEPAKKTDKQRTVFQNGNGGISGKMAGDSPLSAMVCAVLGSLAGAAN
ncbi:hypothetical protein [Bacillus swezeyi]|uniref:Uncharacterized protein n=1 Tax=Bacillus swezeyi TaxID=1925020 RepID=A0A5M8RTI7_9BACI|nr:hypothetical protein [Bacillus swezeyi]KAA6451937.1 hypothetical protein DX927_14635 [Bacillus swezeyi]TYS36160.1 hypothetical protein FZC77_14095 [Bacillus swezeyi]